MNTDAENKVNEFEEEWIQGETEAPAKDTEAAAVVESAQAAVTQADDEYVQAHTDLESEDK